MPLRAKLLALFLLLAIVPLLALGGIEYARSLRALEALIAAQNARVAQRAAETIQSRTNLLRSDLLLLAENADTRHWLSGRARGESDPGAQREAARFVQDAWARMGASYALLTYRDHDGKVIYQLGESAGMPLPGGLDPIAEPVGDAGSAKPFGSVSLQPVLAAIIPLDLLASGFGETGRGMVLDRERGRVLYHPDRMMNGARYDSLIATGAWELGPATLDRSAGTFRYRSGDSLRVASFVSLTSPKWTVVVSGALDEFAGPFTAVRRWTLLLFAGVGLMATLVFSQLLRRTTRSLEELTSATAVVGQGDFAPALPPSGRDEVGRLTASFQTMVTKIREMLAQVESSRQMAVLGQFAAHLSHEIRNPLTSIKLNLQKIEREARDGRLPETTSRPLEIALGEVGRLDGVVRGVLDLTRTRPREVCSCSLHLLVDETLEILAGQAESRGVQMERTFVVGPDTVEVDPSQVKGALLNLALNALDAMPEGGILRVRTARQDDRIRLSIADTGRGILDEAKTEIFRPFFTTKPSGTGLGLSLAKRAIEDNGGSLALAPGGNDGGAEFLIELPLIGAA